MQTMHPSWVTMEMQYGTGNLDHLGTYWYACGKWAKCWDWYGYKQPNPKLFLGFEGGDLSTFIGLKSSTEAGFLKSTYFGLEILSDSQMSHLPTSPRWGKQVHGSLHE